MAPPIIQLHWFWEPLPAWGEAVIREWNESQETCEVRLYREPPADLPDRYAGCLIAEVPPRLRSDLIRYWLMYRDGGIYVDFDSRPLRDLGPLTEHSLALPRVRRLDGFIDNCLMVSDPGQGFWQQCLENCRRPDTWTHPESWFGGCNVYPLEQFNPTILDDAVQEATARERGELDEGILSPVSGPEYIKHYRMSPYAAMKS